MKELTYALLAVCCSVVYFDRQLVHAPGHPDDPSFEERVHLVVVQINTPVFAISLTSPTEVPICSSAGDGVEVRTCRRRCRRPTQLQILFPGPKTHVNRDCRGYLPTVEVDGVAYGTRVAEGGSSQGCTYSINTMSAASNLAAP